MLARMLCDAMQSNWNSCTSLIESQNGTATDERLTVRWGGLLLPRSTPWIRTTRGMKFFLFVDLLLLLLFWATPDSNGTFMHTLEQYWTVKRKQHQPKHHPQWITKLQLWNEPATKSYMLYGSMYDFSKRLSHTERMGCRTSREVLCEPWNSSGTCCQQTTSIGHVLKCKLF